MLDTALRRCDKDSLSRFRAALTPSGSASCPSSAETESTGADGLDAIELARRIEASDVGDVTLDR